MKSILAFSGSNSSKSINRALLELAASKFKEATITLIDLRDYPAPMYSMDIEEETGIPSEIDRLKNLFNNHDAFLISSPEHNGMMPAFLKNMMDWISRTEGKIFQNKPVMLMGTSPGGRGGITNLKNMETLLPHWGASAVFANFSLPNFYDRFDLQTNLLVNPNDNDQLNEAVRELETHLIKKAL